MREEQNAYTVSYDELSIALKRYCDTWFEKHDHAQWEDTYKDGDWHCSKCGAIVEKDEQKQAQLVLLLPLRQPHEKGRRRTLCN